MTQSCVGNSNFTITLVVKLNPTLINFVVEIKVCKIRMKNRDHFYLNWFKSKIM